MANQNVVDRTVKYDHGDAQDSLRKTCQAVAIMQAVALAVTAQENGAVRYDDNRFSRWGPAIDAACARVYAVRDALQNKADSPSNVDWWTPLAILEAAGAALWHTPSGGGGTGAFESEHLRSIAEAAVESLGEMASELVYAAEELSGSAA